MTCSRSLVGTPLGILAGTYLAEYGRYDKTHQRGALHQRHSAQRALDRDRPVHLRNDGRADGPFSGWAGAVALAVIVVPVVVRTTEDMLLLVPNTLREAAASLGVPRSLMIMRIAYRAARAGMVTGVLLAVARISGETAPLLFTALNNQFWSTNLNAPMASLPVVIFQFALSPLRGLAETRLDRRADHHLGRAGAQHRRARACRTGKIVMNVASVTVPTVTHAADRSRSTLQDKISIRNLNFFYGDSRALKDISLSLYDSKVTAFIGPSGCGKSTLLRVLNRMYDLYPNQRADRRGAARRREHPRRPGRISICCARASAWCSRSRRRSRCRSTRTSPSASGSTRSCRSRSSTAASRHALRRAALWDEVKDKLQRQRAEPVRRPAAAAVHRAHRGGEARSDPVRRAVLGARSDLDREDRGADRRAEAGLHDRDRHPQHAAGRARVGLHGLHVSRRTGRVRRDHARSSPTPSDRRTQDYITGRFG